MSFRRHLEDTLF